MPVIDNTHRLIGVVTQTDLVKAHVTNYQKGDSLKDQNRKLNRLSIGDPLTGLPNRRAMEIDIKRTAAVSKRQSLPYSIALIDIDYFKSYNDGDGHQAGDEALIFIADKLCNNLRSLDKIFRYGGEEFLFLMPMTPLERAQIATRRIFDAIVHEKYPLQSSDLGFLNVSIGVASSFSENWVLVVEQADLALYDAKADGQNRISSAEPPSESEFWDFSRQIDEGQPSVN